MDGDFLGFVCVNDDNEGSVMDCDLEGGRPRLSEEKR